MFRRAALALVAVLVAGAAACGGQDDEEGQVETEPVAGELAGAVSSAQAAMPIELPDSRVRVLLQDLCDAGASDTGAIIEQLAGLPVTDPAQIDAVLAALDVGTADLCPGGVAPAVHGAVAAGARAAPPATSSPPTAAAEAPSGGGAGASGRSSSSAGPSGSTSGSGAASGGSSANGSSGSAAVGSGNATGSGNQSSTNFGQNVTSDSSTTTSSTP